MVAYHQDCIQAAIGPCVRICHNQCILSPERSVANYGKAKVTTEELFGKVDDWMRNFERDMDADRSRIQRLKEKMLTPGELYMIIDVYKRQLVIQSDSRQARTDMANTLKSLRRNHYQFYKGKGHYETPDELIDHVSGKKLTLVSDGHFFQYPPDRESVTFIGHIKETSEEFLFRIYDREYFLYLLKRLRTVKKESAQKQINIKS